LTRSTWNARAAVPLGQRHAFRGARAALVAFTLPQLAAAAARRRRVGG
jgi:hypothetical protein